MKKTLEKIVSIGQKSVVDKINRILAAIAGNRNLPLPPLFFKGYRGTGKTRMAKLAWEALCKTTGEAWQFVEISALVTKAELVQKLADLIAHKPCVIFIDEAHMLANDVVAMLLPILETDKECKDVPVGDGSFPANPFQHLWIVASNKRLKDDAFASRFQACEFVEFNRSEVLAMIKHTVTRCKGFKMAEAAIEFVADRVKPFARDIVTMIAGEAVFYAENMGIEAAKAMVREYRYFPQGLRLNDKLTLEYLGSKAVAANGAQVSAIAAHLKLDAQEVSKELQVLAGMGYITTHNGKKFLAGPGREWLANLEQLQKAAKEAAKGSPIV